MTLDPEKLRILNREAIAERERRTPSQEELNLLANKRHAIRLRNLIAGVSQQLEETARTGHPCKCVFIGYRDEPDYQSVLCALRNAGLNVKEEKIKTSGWFSGKRSIVVYFD